MCGMVSFVTNWLVCTFSCNVWQVILVFIPTFCKMNCQRSIQTRRQVYYQHDWAPPHFSQVVRQYLIHKLPNRWIGRGGSQNWSPWSLDLHPLDYHVCGYSVCTEGEHERRTLQRILSAAESINNAAALRKVTSSLVTRVRKCIQPDEGHFHQFAWVLNDESETVHLIT